MRSRGNGGTVPGEGAASWPGRGGWGPDSAVLGCPAGAIGCGPWMRSRGNGGTVPDEGAASWPGRGGWGPDSAVLGCPAGAIG